jgi:hypothetical protein
MDLIKTESNQTSTGFKMNSVQRVLNLPEVLDIDFSLLAAQYDRPWTQLTNDEIPMWREVPRIFLVCALVNRTWFYEPMRHL